MSVGRMKKKGSSPIARMLAACIVGGGIVAAQDGAAQEAPSSNATVNLIRLLVKQHVITQEAADALLKQAEQEAVQAQRQTATVKAIAAQPPPAPATQLSTAATTPPPAGTLRIPYVPEIVKKQIKEDVKKEVIEEAKNENWAQPNAIPEWTKRIKITGDLRSRDEYDLFSSTNDNQIIDFQSFNANGPTDINALTNNGGIPILNTTQDRLNRLSLRARLGVEAVITDDVFAGLAACIRRRQRPVSTTQLLGGGWGKKDFWLDQAYLTLAPSHWFAFTTGRMANPFFHSDLVYDPDLNFDGAAATVETKDHNAKGLDFFANRRIVPAGIYRLEFSQRQHRQEQRSSKVVVGQPGWLQLEDVPVRLEVRRGLLPVRRDPGRIVRSLLPLSGRQAVFDRLVTSRFHAEGKYTLPDAADRP